MSSGRTPIGMRGGAKYDQSVHRIYIENNTVTKGQPAVSNQN